MIPSSHITLPKEAELASLTYEQKFNRLYRASLPIPYYNTANCFYVSREVSAHEMDFRFGDKRIFSDKVLIASSFPQKGEKAFWTKLKNVKCDLIVNLTSDGYESPIPCIHYKNWSDGHEIPHADLHALIKRIEAAAAKKILIHCKAGVGRTGALMTSLALKALKNQKLLTAQNYQSTIFSLIIQGRQQRSFNFVHSFPQYVMIESFAKDLLADQNPAKRKWEGENLNTYEINYKHCEQRSFYVNSRYKALKSRFCEKNVPETVVDIASFSLRGARVEPEKFLVFTNSTSKELIQHVMKAENADFLLSFTKTPYDCVPETINLSHFVSFNTPYYKIHNMLSSLHSRRPKSLAIHSVDTMGITETFIACYKLYDYMKRNLINFHNYEEMMDELIEKIVEIKSEFIFSSDQYDFIYNYVVYGLLEKRTS